MLSLCVCVCVCFCSLRVLYNKWIYTYDSPSNLSILSCRIWVSHASSPLRFHLFHRASFSPRYHHLHFKFDLWLHAFDVFTATFDFWFIPATTFDFSTVAFDFLISWFMLSIYPLQLSISWFMLSIFHLSIFWFINNFF